MERNAIQGLNANWKQFGLLVLINAFVGAMIGIERTILPNYAQTLFGIEAATATLSFIIAFGIVKAISNYFAGRLANKIGRKNLLVIGWMLALPVPLILLNAPSWNWVIFANVLLGVHQGLTWSTNVLMKIELAGEKQRGLAMGLNEFAGYIAVAFMAWLTGYIAQHYGIHPYPFYLGLGIAVIGLLLTIFFVHDTHGHALTEQENNTIPKLSRPFSDTTWKHPQLGSITQAGLVNNLNDGMIWGLFPMVLAKSGFAMNDIGLIAAAYPVTWGLAQLYTGYIGDKVSNKNLLVAGMMIQGIAIAGMVIATSFLQYFFLAILLGLGTALVYPTFLAGIAKFTNPSDRPVSLGIFRLWRDLGYAIGALITGIVSDGLGFDAAILITAGLTILSGLIIQLRMEFY
ncbi:MAG: MFS transporter [Chitinophagaceae bacterium]|nr:MFS transporter [Chitinophagaceae bacterium]